MYDLGYALFFWSWPVDGNLILQTLSGIDVIWALASSTRGMVSFWLCKKSKCIILIQYSYLSYVRIIMKTAKISIFRKITFSILSFIVISFWLEWRSCGIINSLASAISILHIQSKYVADKRLIGEIINLLHISNAISKFSHFTQI